MTSRREVKVIVVGGTGMEGGLNLLVAFLSMEGMVLWDAAFIEFIFY